MIISTFTSATGLASVIRDKTVSSDELTRLYLDDIRRKNPALNAIVISNEADATHAARERDDDLKKGVVRGPLHGVPVTVKESFNLTGLKTTVNFPQLKDNVATDDAFVVRKLKEAGAIVLGKTNIPTMLSDYQSFGPLYPVANNPYDHSRTPGGSTGGGAAAVAAGMTSLEIGSDIGGSIRVPSHFCGVFGLKPTENSAIHGAGHVPPLPNSRAGFVAMASVGPLARTMADIELAWTIINQPTWQYFAHLPARPRAKDGLGDYSILWCDDVGEAACGEETRKLLHQFVDTLRRAGVKAEKKPFDTNWLSEAYAVWGMLFGSISGQDAPWFVRQLMKRQFTSMGRGSVINFVGPLKAGLDLRFRNVSHALKRRADVIADLQRQFDECDFIISPVAAGPAFHHNHTHAPIEVDGRRVAYVDYCMPFNIIYNCCGNPVLVVPGGMSSGGLPIGFQVAAPHYAEQELIHFGKLVEQLGCRFTAPPGD